VKLLWQYQRTKLMSSSDVTVPKVIWILWFQGLSEAPFPVQQCVDSWKRENPTWEVVLLNNENLDDYVTLDLPEDKFSRLSLPKQSNLIRLQVLLKYGGVWADATTFCMKPLDDWLDECTTSGFFAFCNPGRDRVMANWFLAAEEGGPIILKMRDAYVSFFLENNFKKRGRVRRKIFKYLRQVLNRSEKSARFWLSPFVTKVLKVFPYFIFHYLFERLISSDIECQEIWNNTKKISAKPLFRFLRAESISHFSEDIKIEIDERHTPMYKLSWKVDYSSYDSSSALYYLLEKGSSNVMPAMSEIDPSRPSSISSASSTLK